MVDRATGRDSVSSYVRLGAWIGGCFALVLVTVLGLNHAFTLMSRKSDRDFLIGLTIVIILIAVYIPLAVTGYRRLTRSSQKTHNETTDPCQCPPYKSLTAKGPEETEMEDHHDGKA